MRREPEPAPAPAAALRRLVIDQRLEQRLMLANVHDSERVAFMLGLRSGDEARVLAVVLPPLSEASGTHAAFDMRWFTILRTSCRRMELEPPLSVVAWMHSHPRMSIFLSSTDLPTAESFRRYDPQVVAVVVNPYDQQDPIGGFQGGENQRLPVEFEPLWDTPGELLERLAVLGLALPEFDQLIVPDWVQPRRRQRELALQAFQLRLLESERFLAGRIEALGRRLLQPEPPASDSRSPQLAAVADEPPPAARELRQSLDRIERMGGALDGLEQRVSQLEQRLASLERPSAGAGNKARSRRKK